MKLGKGSYKSGKNLPENVTVGNYSSIATHTIFHTNDTGDHLCVENRNCVFTINFRQPSESKPIIIGHDVWIGNGARILYGVTIGNGAIIGAGAVIAKDVPSFAVVVGNPQIIKRFRFTNEQIEALERIKWWDWEPEVVKVRLDDMLDINSFIQKYG